MGVIGDPYALISNPQEVCDFAKHHKGKKFSHRKNCASNPWCSFGMGEHKYGTTRISSKVALLTPKSLTLMTLTLTNPYPYLNSCRRLGPGVPFRRSPRP